MPSGHQRIHFHGPNLQMLVMMLTRQYHYQTYFESWHFGPGKGVNEIGPKGKALVAVCHCDYDLAACGACGKGWSQEKAAGRDPKMIPESDVKKPGGGGGGGTSTRFRHVV